MNLLFGLALKRYESCMENEATSWVDQWGFEGIGSIKDEDAAIATKKMAARNPKDNVSFIKPRQQLSWEPRNSSLGHPKP
ncbi:hypothetical protein PVK06_049283 [Gossypium arboreum]|uniref:Uncharacterized protein n=1 Tax=Gossypium arboreum TaxID=29729 RepID=A0ABR0MIA0_GOSAR|nr:hypothetical protein PVK06_049283 [Gossypium arboreum]